MSVHLNHQNSKKRPGVNGGGSGVPQSQLSEFFSLIRSISIFFIIAFMLRATVVEAFKIPSESMVPTLEKGDHILVNKLSYGLRLPFKTKTVFDFREPKRGDVVVFTLPEDSSTNIIKRVIGLPGDTVEVRGTKLFINNQVYAKDEDYARWVFGGKKNFGPIIVPENRVLLLGDNRDQSKDSRFWPEPTLEMSRIKGRAFVIYWNSDFHFDHVFSLIH